MKPVIAEATLFLNQIKLVRWWLLCCLLPQMTLTVHAAEIKVYAAASLTDVMQALAVDYQAQHGDRIVFNLAGSNVLARQIKQGAPADVFLSADEAQMDALANAGLLQVDTRRDLLSNTIVVVLPAESKENVTAISDLERGIFKRIATGDPQTVPVGVYAKKYLTQIGVWKRIEAKIIPTENVRAALAAVAAGNADAGLVYKTDARSSRDVRIAFELPGDQTRIRYPVALLKNATAPKEAGTFVEYLQSKRATDIFARYGFTMASK